MANIREDIQTASERIAEALSGSGYAADFSPNSLVEVDRFFSEHSANGKPVPGGLLSESVGNRLFSLGAYSGEVLRRNIGGQWQGDDNDPAVEINVELHLPDTTICWPMLRVIKRYEDGPSESVSAWGSHVGLNITRDPWPALGSPVATGKPWWKFW